MLTKTLPTFGITLAMLCALLAPASVSALTLYTEPSNGFVQGEDPEWSSAHETAASDAPNHRQYHRDAEAARIAWLSLYASERGTASYTRAYRLMLQVRNMAHRQYHTGLDLLAAMRARAALDPTLPFITLLSPNGGETYKNDGSPITVHWQTRSVPSSQTLDVIRLRGYPGGEEFPVATNVFNDGQEVIVPSSVPVGFYTLEIKTYVNGTLLMDTSDAPFKIVDAKTPGVSEQVTCVFDTTTSQQSCDTATGADSPLAFGCSGFGNCVRTVNGLQGIALTWKSSCGGYAYSTIDGKNESVHFSCSAASSSSSSSYAARDITPPTVLVTLPDSHAVNVALDAHISAKFDESMYGSTISPTTFVVQNATGTISGNVTLAGTTAIFTPIHLLSPNTAYTVTISSSAKDLAGNRLSRDVTWSFTTTATAGAANQAPASLGAATTFAVLAGSTVTNIGPTVINGDLGVSPGSAVTGFAPGIVNGGGIHATDTMAGQAQAALTVAYNDLAGRTLAPVSVSGNLGGSTLSSGLYKSTSGLEVSSGDLVLDGRGDGNAVFIFQVATTLNVGTGRQIMLIGGAKASNVFWQVGTSANLEANSVFKGSILADQSISLKTGARVDGRLLARIGGVTLQSNTVTVPN